MAAMISELLGMEWGKDCSIESRPMGQSGSDIRLDAEALAKFPFSVECKNQENWSIPAWVSQAKSNQRAGTDWLLIIAKNKVEPLVVMDARRFFEILKSGGIEL